MQIFRLYAAGRSSRLSTPSGVYTWTSTLLLILIISLIINYDIIVKLLINFKILISAAMRDGCKMSQINVLEFPRQIFSQIF